MLGPHPHFTVGEVEVRESPFPQRQSIVPFLKRKERQAFLGAYNESGTLYAFSESQQCYEVIITQKRVSKLREVKYPAQGGTTEGGARVDPGFSRAQDLSPIPHHTTPTAYKRHSIDAL